MNDKAYGLFVIDYFHNGRRDEGWLTVRGETLGKEQLFAPHYVIKGYPSRAKAEAAKEQIESEGVRLLHNQYSQLIQIKKVPEDMKELVTIKERE